MRERIRRTFADYDPARHRMVLFNPNASELLPQRRWPAEHFAQLAERILAGCARTSSFSSPARPRRTRRGAARPSRPAPPRQFRRLPALTELPALYHLAELMVTNDSGPGHFASVTGMPTISLFGPETPGALRAARQLPAGHRRAGLQPLRFGGQPPQDGLHRRRLHAGHLPRPGLGRGAASARRRDGPQWVVAVTVYFT